MQPSVNARNSHEQSVSNESRASFQFETVTGRARLEVVLPVVRPNLEYARDYGQQDASGVSARPLRFRQ